MVLKLRVDPKEVSVVGSDLNDLANEIYQGSLTVQPNELYIQVRMGRSGTAWTGALDRARELIKLTVWWSNVGAGRQAWQEVASFATMGGEKMLTGALIAPFSSLENVLIPGGGRIREAHITTISVAPLTFAVDVNTL